MASEPPFRWRVVTAFFCGFFGWLFGVCVVAKVCFMAFLHLAIGPVTESSDTTSLNEFAINSKNLRELALTVVWIVFLFVARRRLIRTQQQISSSAASSSSSHDNPPV